MVIDLNRASLSDTPFCVALNAAIERAEPPEENTRRYLGASTIGSQCMRKVQFDWMCDPVHPTQTRDIFRRGHLLEELSRQHLIRAGFEFASREKLSFSAAGRFFRGHSDGILTAGPELPDVVYPCLWEHKALGDKGWRALERDGIDKAYPQYTAQCQIYMAYLDDVAEHPAIFTATNANTMARLHLLVPFNAERAQFWSDRAVTIIEATKRGELLPRAYAEEDWRCRSCGHRDRCWRQP
jgi:hypothetical protein